MRKYNLPIFIPHRGCPHDCVFCNQRKITGVDTDVTPDMARYMISDFLKTTDLKDASVEVAFFGGSFTGLDLALQEEFLCVASEFFPQIGGIRLSTRPDYISDEVLTLLNKYNVTTVELGVQSTNDDVLRLNNRGHSFNDVKKASQKIKAAGILLGHQMMIGMYGSDAQKDIQTVSDIIDLKPSCVRIYPVITLKETHLETLYHSGEYSPYSIEKAAEISKCAVLKFRENDIDVIRIGLHASEDLEDTGNIVAGPYHPAFGEIVESLIYRDLIEEKINDEDIKKGYIIFNCPKKDISKVVGHKGMNKAYFKDKYAIDLKISSN